LRFFAGEVRDVFSFAHRYQEAHGDQFAAIIDFESGAMGEYVSHWLSPGGWRVVLFGHGVTVEFKPLETGRWTDSHFQVHEIEVDPMDIQFKPGFYRQVAAFADLVRGAAPRWPLVNLEGAYLTMHLAERISGNIEDRSLTAKAADQ
jgi:predicted dehydrogenase